MAMRKILPCRRVLLAGCLLAALGQSHAAGLLALYRDALQSDPQFGAARAERKSADAALSQSRGQLMPQVTANASAVRNEQSVATKTSAGVTQKNYDFTARSASLNLQQAIFRPQLWLAYRQSQAQVQQGEAELLQARQDLILRLAQAYFDVLLAEDNLALTGEQKAALAQQLKQTQRYFEAGVGTITDINETQARFDSVQAEEIAASNSLEIKRRAIEQIVGKWYQHLDRLTGEFPLELPKPVVVEQWLEFSLANNPALKAREVALEIAARDVQKAYSGHLPSIDLVAGRTHNRDPGYTTLDTDGWNNTLGVQFSLPLFTGGSTRGRVDQALAGEEKAQQELEQIRRKVLLATREEFLNVVNGMAQITALKQAVKSNEVALYSARRGLEAGTRTSFDVLNAQQLLVTAKRDLAQARYRYVLSRLKLRAAAGLLDDEDVEYVQGFLQSTAN